MKIYKTIFLLIFVTLFSACDDKLELSDPNNMIAENYWASAEQAQAGIDAAYNNLLIDGYYMRMTPALTDGRADDFRGDTPWPDLMQVSNFTILPTADPVQWVWAAYYQQIFRVNQVLQKVPEIEMDESYKSRIIGQAHFLRGLAYFHLKINFEKVPLVLVPAEGEDYNTPTASEEEIWNQIIADFQKSQELLPVDYESISGPDKGQIGRATKGAATGFLGKTYLYTEKWEQAAGEFDKLVNGPDVNIYSLVDNYRDNFGPFNENNPESLFEVQFEGTDEVGGTVMNYGGEPSGSWMQVSSVGHTYAMDGYGYSDFLPTQWIYEEFKEEQTVDGGVDPRLLATIASYEPGANSTTVYNGVEWPHAEEAIYPRKYTHDGFGFDLESQGSVELSEINYRVMRYADVLLMYAEALNETGQTQQAYQYIQQVRDRANLPDLEEVKPGMSQNEMREQIAHERALELSVESIRYHDIVRWGWLYDSDKLEEIRAHDSEFNTWSEGKEYLPIPQSELDVNPNLEPNSAN